MAKHEQTLKAIFDTPTRGTLPWKEIESLLVSLGAIVREGDGSRIRVSLGGIVSGFHRPHPRKEASKGSVESVREMLRKAGHEPVERGRNEGRGA